MANVTRQQLDQSNNTLIGGVGLVTKQRHSAHNNKIADYVDSVAAPIYNSISSVEQSVSELEDTVSGLEGGTLNVNPSDSPTLGVNNYNANDAGTYTNFSGIVVTPPSGDPDNPGDMDKGIVQLRRVGLSSAFVKVIVPVDKDSIRKSNLSEALEEEIEGTSGGELTQGLLSGNTGGLEIGNGAYVFNQIGSKFLQDCFLISIDLVSIGLGGNVDVVAGTWAGAGFTPREVLGTFTLSGGTVIQTLEIGGAKVLNNEYVALRSSATSGYPSIAANDSTGNFQPGDKLTNASSTALLGQGALNSYYLFLYHYSLTGSVLSQTFVKKTDFELELTKEASKNGQEEGVIVMGVGTSYSDQALSYVTSGYYLNNTPAPADGKLTELRINMPVAGDLILAIGLIDQFGVFKESKELTLSVVVGVNTVQINEDIKAGEMPAIKLPNATGLRVQAVGGDLLMGTQSGYNAPLVSNPGHLSMTWDFVSEYKTAFATRSEYDGIANKVAVLEGDRPLYERSPDGNRWRLTVSNAGVVSAVSAEYSKMLVLGNSITKHGLASYWWGVWGMAASRQEKDFVHVLASMLGVTQVNENISAWELNHVGFDLSTFAPFFSNSPDLVVIRLGENVSSLTGYEASLTALVNYCKANAAAVATIVLTGVFWTSSAKDTIHQSVSVATGAVYVPLYQLDTPENKSFIGATVYDADDNPHVVDNAGVANHPGDLGMQRIAEAIYSVL